MIDLDFGDARDLDLRESPGSLRVAHRVREALRARHSYEEGE